MISEIDHLPELRQKDFGISQSLVLPFEAIIAMDETEVDVRIARHLQNEALFNDPGYLLGDRKETRRLEVKRIALALLEGILASGPSFASWYGRVIGDPADPIDVGESINSLVTQHFSPAFKEQVREMRNNRSRRIKIKQPTLKVLSLYALANAILSTKGLKILALEEIFVRVRRGVEDGPSPTESRTTWSVERLMKVYLFTIQGLDAESIASRLETDRATLKSIKSSRFTKAAKENMDGARVGGAQRQKRLLAG